MKVHILDIEKPRNARANKDTNGGFGTVNEFGNSLLTRFLTVYKDRTMNFPELLPGYVISIFKKRGVRVTYDKNRFDPESEIILIPTSIINFNSEIKYASRIKNEQPNIIIGFIGGMASGNPELYKDKGDFVIVGEIENLLLHSDIAGIKGVYQAGFVPDLDTIPFPDWSHWLKNKQGYRIWKRTQGISLPVQGSRGCPMPCSFYCTYPLVQGSQFRARSPENIIEEITYLKKDYHVDTILFRDPIFSLNKSRVEQFCESVLTQNIKFKWICETHPKFLSPALIQLMSRAGCVAVKLGIESPNFEVMKKSHRLPDNLLHQEAIIRSCEEQGIDVLGFYILGYFDDNEDSVKDTIQYACRLNTFGAQFTIATPYPGTPWYEVLKSSNEQNQLNPDLELYTQYRLVYNHPKLTDIQLSKLKNSAYQAYYFRWNYLRKHFLKKY